MTTHNLEITSNRETVLSFGTKLRYERVRLGLTQDVLAKIGGVARTTQHIYETDSRKPDITYLEKISNCGVNISYLVSDLGSGAYNIVQPVSFSDLKIIFSYVDKFCIDENGRILSTEVRAKFFQLLWNLAQRYDVKNIMDDAVLEELKNLHCQ